MTNTPHFILTPHGSSGDVFPYIGIGRELARRGHDVTVMASERFRDPITDAGLDFVPTISLAEFDRVTQDPDLWHPRRGLKVIFHMIVDRLEDAYHQLEELYEPGRTVLVGHSLAFSTRIFEDKHGTPAATVHLAPSAFRSMIQPAVLPPGRSLSTLPRPAQRLTWWILDRVFIDPHIEEPINALRERLGLPRVQRIFASWIHSPQLTLGLFPDWFGPPQEDWPASARLTGFPLFDDAERNALDTETEAFFEAGDPPILFTAGSANVQAASYFATAAEACNLLGQRGLFVTSNPSDLPETLPAGSHCARFLPFSLAFPRSAVVVHHGGVGTCAQGLAAGVPQLVVPMGYDQPDNATRLATLGVGTWVEPKRGAGDVAHAIDTLLRDAAVREACARYRGLIRGADPVAETCDLLEQLAAARLG